MRIFCVVILAVCLSGCGNNQPTAAGGKPVSYWLQALQSPDVKLRKQAVFKLGNVGAADEAVLPALIGALRDVDAGVRSEAIVALLKYGDAAKEAIPALAELENKDRDSKVRAYAAKALQKLQADK